MVKITLKQIRAEILAKYEITEEQFSGRDKRQRLVDARREFVHRASNETRQNASAIARFMNRDHTTIIHYRQTPMKTKLNPPPKPAKAVIAKTEYWAPLVDENKLERIKARAGSNKLLERMAAEKEQPHEHAGQP